MNKQAKTILSLDAKKALDFFMKSEQYHGFELPVYFNFDEVLKSVRETIGRKKYDTCVKGDGPENLPDVNIEILLNKDGHYAVRPLVLANPYLYYFLAKEICSASSWKTIQKCFEAYTVPHIKACALPIIPPKQESFHKSATILNWWNSMEQRSLELSLEYRYMFVTDITNCYGSIIPQSIEWALTCKDTPFENMNNRGLANDMQKYLCAMQHGHNIGIPQGSTLFDFVAEMVLGYSDLLLHQELEKLAAEYKKEKKVFPDYEILRYRDDYRVFCNNKDALEKISYRLQAVLERFNFRMNSQKTKISESIVTDSIKPDKLFFIYNTPIFSRKHCDFNGIQKHLLYILMFSRKYPNCGQLRTMLSDLNKRVEEKLKSHKMKMREEFEIDLQSNNIFKRLPRYKEVEMPGRILENVRAITAVATQIALENVSVCHYALRIISRVVDSLADNVEKQDIIEKVYKKLCNQPNSDYNQLWLQNITHSNDEKKKKSNYQIPLCQLVAGKKDVQLWNNSWLKPNLADILPVASVVDREALKNSGPVIDFRETILYNDMSDIDDEILGSVV